MKKFVIFYNSVPMITIENIPKFTLPSEVLDKYAKFSGFERRSLTYCYVFSLEFEEL